MSRRHFCRFICAAVALLPFLESSVHAQRFPVRSGVITARLESNKSVYQVGEPIKLRLTLINRMGQTVFFVQAAPYGLSHLEVFSAKGKAAPSGERRTPSSGVAMVRSIPLYTGRPVVVKYYPRERQGRGYVYGSITEWADINEWGYVLEHPGNYTLIASLNVAAVGNRGPFFTTSPTDKSNAVHITIIK
jgi:hypothetical protein